MDDKFEPGEGIEDAEEKQRAKDRSNYFAHSAPGQATDVWQSLPEHLMQAASKAAAFANVFGAGALARLGGCLHDVGKYAQKFQDRLHGDPHRVDHATWGARIARERYGPLGTLLAYAIAGHHAGLADGAPDKDQQRSTLRERLSDDYHKTLPPLLPEWERELVLPEKVGLPEGFRPTKGSDRGAFQFALLTRMIFSCLVDADFIDTDNFYRRIEGKATREENTGPSLQALRDRLNTHLASLPKNGGVNPIRAHVLGHVRGKAAEKPGLFSLTVPTGGGKTLASMAFALDHAIAHGLRRVIYVIPFTSIVEQNAQVFRDAFGELGEKAVLEHHSAFDDEAMRKRLGPNDGPQAQEKRWLAMENWDAPVVVTTAVQFFESLFSDRPSRCRKLHNIAGSVVILDEAQTLPLDLLRPCVTLLDELALNYRASLVLCTATQPALRKDQGFKGGLENVRELAPEPRELYRQLRRVTVRHIGRLDDEALADHLRQREQVLCIVNNRRHASQLFQSIADQPGAGHLTTLMYARHRSQVLTEVRQRLKDGKPCRLVATSLIEAGVDISFPTVLRAEAGLDSIAQAGGRCNREGLSPIETSEVLIFATANKDWKPPQEVKALAEAFGTIAPRHKNDLLSLEAIEAYFTEVYWKKGEQLDKYALLDRLRKSGIDSLPFETLAAKFRIIQTAMRPIIVPFVPGSDQMDPDIEKVLRELPFAPAIARKLQPFLVQVPRQAYDALLDAHAIQAVAPDRYGDQFIQLVNSKLYDEQYGLHWRNPQFLTTEKLMW